MIRKYLNLNGFTLSYLDNEKSGAALICLHGHFGCASMFTFMEEVYNGRLILIDQRGHGLSSHTKTYSREDYLCDLNNIIQYEKIVNPIILGHSLGGVNAYQYAAHFKNIKALIIEDIGTEIKVNNDFILQLPESFNSIYKAKQEFQKINIELDAYFLESMSYNGTKWLFNFDRQGMVKSGNELNGNYWDDWEQIECPVLLMHGTNSWATYTKNILLMAHRENVSLKLYENVGHTIRDERRDKYVKDIKEFLNTLIITY